MAIIIDNFNRYDSVAKTYRKKPLDVKAVQLAEPFQVITLEGTLNGNAEDYLVQGVFGELYPCKKEVFEETYYEVEPLVP